MLALSVAAHSFTAHSVSFAGYAFVFMRDSRDGDDAIHKLDGCVTAACCCPELLHLRRCICLAAIEILTLLAWNCSMEFGRRRRPLRVEWAKVGMKHILHLMMTDYDALIHPLQHSPVCLCSCSGQTDTVSSS